MITLEQEPDLLSFSKNDLIYKLSTDNYVATPGVKARLDIRAFPIDDKHITIEWETGSITFNAESALDNSGYTVREFTGSMGSAFQKNTYLNDVLIKDLNSNELFYQTFETSIYVESTSVWWIRIEAREEGTEFDFTVSSNGSLDQDNAVAAVEKVIRDNFKIVIEILADGFKSLINNKPITITTLEEIPDDNQEVEFNISAILDRYLGSQNSDMPDYDQSEITASVNGSVAGFFIRFREVYGDPVEDYLVQTSDLRYIIYGGLKKQDWKGNTIIPALSEEVKPFLTLMPIKKTIGKNHQEYLFYFTSLIYLGGTRVKIYYSDGSSETINIDLPGEVSNRIIKVPTGFLQLGLDAYETDDVTIVKYIVSLYDDTNTIVSEERTYLIDTVTYTNERFFYYRNSLGGYDSLRVIGDSEVNMNADFDTSERILTADYTSMTGQRVRSNLNYNEVIEVGTGLLDKEFKIALMDFVMSPEAYEDINGKFVSIDILNKEEKIYSDSEDVHPMIIKYSYNFTNRGYNR